MELLDLCKNKLAILDNKQKDRDTIYEQCFMLVKRSLTFLVENDDLFSFICSLIYIDIELVMFF